MIALVQLLRDLDAEEEIGCGALELEDIVGI
jgi:hypothetical protein